MNPTASSCVQRLRGMKEMTTCGDEAWQPALTAATRRGRAEAQVGRGQGRAFLRRHVHRGGDRRGQGRLERRRFYVARRHSRGTASAHHLTVSLAMLLLSHAPGPSRRGIDCRGSGKTCPSPKVAKVPAIGSGASPLGSSTPAARGVNSAQLEAADLPAQDAGTRRVRRHHGAVPCGSATRASFAGSGRAPAARRAWTALNGRTQSRNVGRWIPRLVSGGMCAHITGSC